MLVFTGKWIILFVQLYIGCYLSLHIYKSCKRRIDNSLKSKANNILPRQWSQPSPLGKQT